MVSQKQLRITAKEMVQVLGLTDDDKDPIVIAKEATVAELSKIIKEAIPLIDPKTDKFTEETLEVLAEFTAQQDSAPKKPVKKPLVYEAPAEEEEEEAEEEEEEEEVPAPKKKVKPVVEEEEEEEEAPAPKKKVKPVVEEEEEDEAEAPAPKKKVKAPKEKAEKAPSPYGTSVEVMCTNPDMPFDKLTKELVKRGINVEAGKSAVNTGYGVVRKIVSLLRKNGLMK